LIAPKHRELAVAHVFRFAERREYPGVIRDAHSERERPITTRRWTMNAAEKLATCIIETITIILEGSASLPGSASMAGLSLIETCWNFEAVQNFLI